MTTSSRFALVGWLALALPGCSDSVPAPPRVAARPAALAPSTVVYRERVAGSDRLLAIPEDGSGAARVLSAAGLSTGFVADLGGGRALLVERAADATLARLVAVSVEGGGRVPLGELPAGRYAGTRRALTVGDAVAVELSRAGAEQELDVVVARAGAAPIVVASRGALVGGSPDGLAVVLGTGAVDGAGELVTLSLDGAARTSLGPVTHALDAGTSARVVFARGGATLSARLDGSDVRTVAVGALPAALAGERVLVLTTDGALAVAPLLGGAPPRAIDHGDDLSVGLVAGGRVLYDVASPDGLALRVARLDGGAPTQLVARPLWIPIPVAVTDDGRVVFHRALASGPDGGALYAIRLDGSGLAAIGTAAVDGVDGASGPADQDFEAVTPSGRIIFEAEYEGRLGSRLLATTATSPLAQALTPFAALRFVSLLRP